MPKKILEADACVPILPRVRFMRTSSASKAGFTDVTNLVTQLEILVHNNGTETFVLLRLDSAGVEVWQTRHSSLDEAHWQARFEYGLEAQDWRACDDPK